MERYSRPSDAGPLAAACEEPTWYDLLLAAEDASKGARHTYSDNADYERKMRLAEIAEARRCLNEAEQMLTFGVLRVNQAELARLMALAQAGCTLREVSAAENGGRA